MILNIHVIPKTDMQTTCTYFQHSFWYCYWCPGINLQNLKCGRSWIRAPIESNQRL